MLTGPLRRLLAYHCTCKSGAGTNRACAHTVAVCMGLFAPEFVRTVKKKTGRLTDISLPAGHQPTMTGKGSGKSSNEEKNGNSSVFYQGGGVR